VHYLGESCAYFGSELFISWVRAAYFGSELCIFWFQTVHILGQNYTFFWGSNCAYLLAYISIFLLCSFDRCKARP